MESAACPNCGAPLNWSSPALPVKVCASCRSTVVRRDGALENLGQAAILPFDVSPIQLGTQGSHDGVHFSVIGRIRWGWTDGSWNEWLLLFDDGSNAWLGEAMGDYMLTRERALDGLNLPQITAYVGGQTPNVGDVFDLDGTRYTATDIKTAQILASEGELPFRCGNDWSIMSADFRSTARKIASFQRDDDGASLYIGDVVSLADLKAWNLRSIEGWTPPSFQAA
ncbi:MAG: DUF4178 domain-containing protein [Sphingomonadaceae bacterium]|nr:DUF4178 domain-containing protein [Sphingomonadaceae bacterium]